MDREHPGLAMTMDKWPPAKLRAWLEGRVFSRIREQIAVLTPTEFFRQRFPGSEE